MPERELFIRRRYLEGVWAFVAGPSEDLRERAFRLGREALEGGVGILDLALLQKEAAAGLEPGPAQERAAEFFAEALAPYEMRLRGAEEANALLKDSNLALERRVEERTRGLREKEAQLHQARKMEAIGRLAGGVAHDFNNILTVICGYLDLCLETRGQDGSALEGDLRRARKAADQAAVLTRQLLTFSRKQAASPRSVDLNDGVAETLGMLKRLVSEAVVIDFHPSEDPCLAWVDPGQLSQILMNLVINARDAMPKGGRIRVATAAVELSAEHLGSHPGALPGRYAMVSIQDDGVGMDAETQARIFEPFFSTKAAGHGTGLGLSTVYAIVEQSGGLITVHSEAGRGTTFKVFLPPAAEAAGREAPAAAGPESGHETLLLVEDNDSVRSLARTVLESAGYEVLEAALPSQALALAGRPGRELPLLVTDMVMPEMDGKALYERLKRDRPLLRALFLSGFPSNEDSAESVKRVGLAFLNKPFSPAVLTRRVREILDAPPAQP